MHAEFGYFGKLSYSRCGLKVPGQFASQRQEMVDCPACMYNIEDNPYLKYTSAWVKELRLAMPNEVQRKESHDYHHI